MHLIDTLVVLAYFVVVSLIGFAYRKLASRSLESYFLGGKSMHWSVLAMSGALSTFDITGTMWIVTLITLFGMKSMWNHWMWGFLMGAFFLAYMGKWVRRSRVMTGAEWMATRFGTGAAGRAARYTYALMAVVTLTAFIGYMFKGIGKFAAVYVDMQPVLRILADLMPGYSQYVWMLDGYEVEVCAIVVFAITSLYVLLGGLYGVVITNVIQTVILTGASLLLAALAYTLVTPEMVDAAVSSGWASVWPVWTLPPEQAESVAGGAYAGYHFFGALVIVWVLKGLLLNAGGPGQMYDFQMFLAARNARDAAKLGAAWSLFLIVRWAMCMGIAMLAVGGLVDLSDPEQVMPIVLQRYLWVGVRGVVIAGLLAAFMSTFSAQVNSAASYVVRDLWQPLVGENTSQEHLIWASRLATVGVVVAGTAIGIVVPSIGRIFSWIMMELGAAFVVPNVLRWHWWRLNGWGYAWGTLAGLVGAAVVPALGALPYLAGMAGGAEQATHFPAWLTDPPLYVSFPAICLFSLVGCLVGTYATRPTGNDVLVPFFESVRPFGAWAPIRRSCRLAPRELAAPGENAGRAILNVALGSIAILGVYMGPMYLVGHWHMRAAAWLAAAGVCCVLLFFTWYRYLPPSDE